MENWINYVFMRNNPRGIHVEHWQHSSGCRAFLKITRDTVTHEITVVMLENPWSVEKKS
jgi:heterotetrameric sarcosine oxidase delta subunit